MSLPALDTVLPFPSERDLDEVRSALEQAWRAWQRAEGHDALRALKRAAREAADHDQVERALELSKAVADLASHLDDESEEVPRRSTVIPCARPLDQGRVPAPPRLPNLTRGQLPSIPAIDEQPIPLARRAPAGASKAGAPEAGASKAGAPADGLPEREAPERGVPARDVPLDDRPAVSIFEDDDEEPTVVRAASASPPRVEARPPPLPPTTSTVQVPAFDEAPTPIGLTASRVAVTLDPTRQRLEVRPLGTDEAPPSGTPVAMLVASSAHDAERLADLLRQLARW